MKLYGGHTSPFVRHCRIALIEENLDFDLILVDSAAVTQHSPTGKVPYFNDGDLSLSDSSSIIKYVREKAGKGFLTDIRDFELFTMTNTVLDAALNVFFLENEGLDSNQIGYLGKQISRVEKGLAELNSRIIPENGISQDSALRCACFISWALFRNRISIEKHDNLKRLMNTANLVSAFSSTAPFDAA